MVVRKVRICASSSEKNDERITKVKTEGSYTEGSSYLYSIIGRRRTFGSLFEGDVYLSLDSSSDTGRSSIRCNVVGWGKLGTCGLRSWIKVMEFVRFEKEFRPGSVCDKGDRSFGEIKEGSRIKVLEVTGQPDSSRTIKEE